MNSLEKIQKVFHVFQILSKIAMIFSFVTGIMLILGSMVFRYGAELEAKCS